MVNASRDALDHDGLDAALQSRSPDELAALDLAHVWHPFTPMRRYGQIDPLVIARGDGVRVQDTHGRWYFDGTSSIWLNVHGHRVDAIDEAIRRQLDRIAHATLLGQGNVPSILLAERLAQVTPAGLEHSFFVDNGAGAVEAAIKIAIQFFANRGEDRRFILGFTGNYHGDTLGAVGVAPDDLFHTPFLGLLPGHPRVRYPSVALDPDPATARDIALAEVGRTLAERTDIAAVIVEPVEGAGGIIPAPPGFLAGLRSACDDSGVLLIVDEVATGFGRTGSMFACETDGAWGEPARSGAGIVPDLLCLGKGLTGGYLPVAATMATEEVFEVFLGEPEEGKTFFHGHSYTGNPLGCAAALANLDLMDDLIPTLPAKVRLLADELAAIADETHVADVRQAGFMTGIDLAAEAHPDPAKRRSFPAGAMAGWEVADAARARGLLIRPIGDTITFMPPPGASIGEMTEMTAELRGAFADARAALEAKAKAS